MNQIRCTETETLYQSSRMRLALETFATPQGPVRRPVVHHPGAVAMLAQPDPEHVVLVHQYRYAVRDWTWEIPAGTREAGEEPLTTAQRELAEEAGLAAAQWQEWFRFVPSYGLTDEEMIVYHCQDLRPASGEADHGELISAEVCSLATVRVLFQTQRMRDAKTLLALSRLPGLHDLLGAPPCWL